MVEALAALAAFRTVGDVVDQPWGFVRAVAEAFGHPLGADDGVDAREVAAAEERLGLPLPRRLHEAYLLFGRRTDLTSAQDHLLEPARLRTDPADEVLVFRVENQWCAWWGVPVASSGQDDPPVLVERRTADGTGDGWAPHAERLSVALAEMALFELSMAQDCGDNRELDETARATLDRTFPRLPLPDLPLWPEPDGPPVRWFSGPDVVLRDDGGTWLWVLGRSAEAVQSVRDRLPGDWLCAP